VKVAEPKKREAGEKVAVSTLVAKLKRSGRSDHGRSRRRRTRQRALNDATAKTSPPPRPFGGDVDVLVAGHNARRADAAAKLAGVRKVLLAEGAAFSPRLAEAVAALVVPLMAGYDAVFFAPPPPRARTSMPRIAAKLDVMQISEIVESDRRLDLRAPDLCRQRDQTVKSADAKKVVTVRGTAFQAAAGEGGSASVETAAAAAGPFKSASSSRRTAKSDRPELTSRQARRLRRPRARLGDKFNQYIEPLADKLGAASAPRAPRSTPATPRTTTRSARPARSSPRSSTSPSASRAPSSTSPA
jgi:electron transfer flavoprotein alpha subunit